MKIESITLREIHMPLVHFFETSFGRVYSRRILLVSVEADGVRGWGECVAGEDPFYSPEWTETAWPTIQHYLARLQKAIQTPICLDESILNARDADFALEIGACRIINIKVGRVGGFSEAKNVHDVALQHNVPVWCGG